MAYNEKKKSDDGWPFIYCDTALKRVRGSWLIKCCTTPYDSNFCTGCGMVLQDAYDGKISSWHSTGRKHNQVSRLVLCYRRLLNLIKKG